MFKRLFSKERPRSRSPDERLRVSGPHGCSVVPGVAGNNDVAGEFLKVVSRMSPESGAGFVADVFNRARHVDIQKHTSLYGQAAPRAQIQTLCAQGTRDVASYLGVGGLSIIDKVGRSLATYSAGIRCYSMWCRALALNDSLSMISTEYIVAYRSVFRAHFSPLKPYP